MNETSDPQAVTRRLHITDHKARILVAEDDDDMRDLIACSLRKDGYEVVVARDGAELLARLAMANASTKASEKFDLVISDIRMPAYSGITVLEGLRAEKWTVPVILMTAFGDDATRKKVEENEGILFDKPFDVDDLRTAVLYLLHKHDGSTVCIASYESSLEAWSMKWTIQGEGIWTELRGLDLYVYARDADRALAIMDRHSSPVPS
jgi:DNA-binding response OmpR family regulator